MASMSQLPAGNEKQTAGEVVRASFKELGETLVAFVKAPKALWGDQHPIRPGRADLFRHLDDPR
jgi:hypothetical protein